VSPTNAELVSDAIDAYNRGDLDGAPQDAAPDLELDWSRAIGPYRGMYRLDQIRALFDTFGEAFASVRFEPEEFIEVSVEGRGPGSRGTQRGLGRRSGGPPNPTSLPSASR
jgi:ketosteroid isomerase-like protein